MITNLISSDDKGRFNTKLQNALAIEYVRADYRSDEKSLKSHIDEIVKFNDYSIVTTKESLRFDLKVLEPYRGTWIHKMTVIASFTLSPLPGNNQWYVSHDVWTHHEYRGKGIGNILLTLREEAAEYMWINLFATVRSDNTIEINLLKKHGWKSIYKWWSNISEPDEHEVEMWIRTSN